MIMGGRTFSKIAEAEGGTKCRVQNVTNLAYAVRRSHWQGVIPDLTPGIRMARRDRVGMGLSRLSSMTMSI